MVEGVRFARAFTPPSLLFVENVWIEGQSLVEIVTPLRLFHYRRLGSDPSEFDCCDWLLAGWHHTS
jgi:hypothetical protein